MARFAGNAKLNNSGFWTTTIIEQCASPRGLIRETFAIDSKKFARARMQRQLHAPGRINVSRCREGTRVNAAKVPQHHETFRRDQRWPLGAGFDELQRFRYY